ncbi:cation:proton antiporter [Pendulispora albinea]|uniref:Cation:proton antiporter n=1 Tax=Pendulispora albinea TaxID=2741071 RepID=A0ABZ2LZN4_9BACT
MSLLHTMAPAAETAVGAKAEEVVLHLLVQLIVILIATRIVVAVVKKFGQTDVAGEILAGLLLGPSFLGALAPDAMAHLFDASTSKIFVGLAQLGLVLLMFQIGLEFEFKTNLNTSKRSVAVVSVMGMVVPFALGYATSLWFYDHLPEPRPSVLGFRLFFGIAMSITAIPVLGRIFMELGLSHTRTAALTIGAAAIDDVVGWLLLGIVTLVVQERFAAGSFLVRVAALLVYLGFLFFVLRPILKRTLIAHVAKHGGLTLQTIAYVLILLLVSATTTSLLGVFAVIGGFTLGAALHDERDFVNAWKQRVSPLVTTLFLPIFFAYTGLRTDVRGLATAADWGVCLLVIAVAFVSKFGGAYLGARLVGEGSRSALAVGICMNTRALMELIAINVGYDLGVLPRSMFTMLVLMAIASTYITTPIIRILLRGQERTSEGLLAPPAAAPERSAA